MASNSISSAPYEHSGHVEQGPNDKKSTWLGSLGMKLREPWPSQVQDFQRIGYRGVATQMGLHRSPFAIFRRFGDLNMLNLMSLQAELMDLSDDFREICKEDDEEIAPLAARKYAYSFRDLRDSATKQGTGTEQVHFHQWQRLQELRQKLKEYSKFP